MRGAVQSKLDALKADSTEADPEKLSVTFNEVHNVIQDMYESKVVKLVKKLPRSHLVLLGTLVSYTRSKSSFAACDLWLSETELLNLYNRKASRLLIDRISPGELSDIVQTLTNSDILLIQDSKTYKSKVKNVKAFKVCFKCELEEIEGALAQSNYSDELY